MIILIDKFQKYFISIEIQYKNKQYKCSKIILIQHLDFFNLLPFEIKTKH